MLSLASETPRAWVQRVAAELDEFLIDHAHCEKKAASTALSLMFRYPEHGEILRPLSEIAREELRHFEEVLSLVEARGVTFRRLIPSEYAKRLRKAVRGGEPDHLMDTLICCALIEARSCERMKLLSEELEDRPLAAFYGTLLASEARHFATYLDLAERLGSREQVRTRLAVLASHEAAALAATPAAARMHA